MIYDFLKSYFPHARSDVLQAVGDAFPAALKKYSITENMLALALGQVFVESCGLSIFDENLHYSASRIVQIFGIGHNSAAVTSFEANRLAGNPRALAERVYGTGRKAQGLGNLSPADGWVYRGGGPIQCTGRGMFAQVSKKTGVDFVGSPNKARNPAYFWDMTFGFFMVKNAMDYLNKPVNNISITKITRITNGGFTALDARISATGKALDKIRRYNALSFTPCDKASASDEDAPVPYSKNPPAAPVDDTIVPYRSPSEEILAKYGDENNPNVKDLQKAFITLNYWIGEVTGNFNVLTRDSLFAYQANNGFDLESVLRVKHMYKLAAAAPRLLPVERQDATAKTPALQESFTIKAAKWLKGISVSALGLIGITASPSDTWNSIFGAGFINRTAIHSVIDPIALAIKDIVNTIGLGWIIRALAIVAAVAVFGLAAALIKDRVNQYKNGANLHL